MGDQLVGVDRRAIGERHHGDDLLAPSLAGPARDHDVGDGRMRRDRHLDLLGEDLLAAGVDGHRVTAEQLDGAVREMAGPVARHRVANPGDRRGTWRPS